MGGFLDDVGDFFGDAADAIGDAAGAVGHFVGDNVEEIATIGAIAAAPFTGGATLAALPLVGPGSAAIRGIAGPAQLMRARVFDPRTGAATGQIVVLPENPQPQPLIIPIPIPAPARQDLTPVLVAGVIAVPLVLIALRR